MAGTAAIDWRPSRGPMTLGALHKIAEFLIDILRVDKYCA